MVVLEVFLTFYEIDDLYFSDIDYLYNNITQVDKPILLTLLWSVTGIQLNVFYGNLMSPNFIFIALLCQIS